jgi:hypothetical protein
MTGRFVPQQLWTNGPVFGRRYNGCTLVKLQRPHSGRRRGKLPYEESLFPLQHGKVLFRLLHDGNDAP